MVEFPCQLKRLDAQGAPFPANRRVSLDPLWCLVLSTLTMTWFFPLLALAVAEAARAEDAMALLQGVRICSSQPHFRLAAGALGLSMELMLPSFPA